MLLGHFLDVLQGLKYSQLVERTLTELLMCLREAGRLRNDVAHCSFGYVAGSKGQFTKTPARAKGKKKQRDSGTIVDPFSGIKEACKSICKTKALLHDFTVEYL
jgi:hypothetical protein